MSSADTLISNLEQIMMYMLLFSEFETSEASYFNEADIIEFLHWFHKLEKYHEIIHIKLIKMLLNYYKYEKHNYMRTLKDFVKKN